MRERRKITFSFLNTNGRIEGSKLEGKKIAGPGFNGRIPIGFGDREQFRFRDARIDSITAAADPAPSQYPIGLFGLSFGGAPLFVISRVPN